MKKLGITTLICLPFIFATIGLLAFRKKTIIEKHYTWMINDGAQQEFEKLVELDTNTYYQ